jgi:hypothetical protein
MPGAIRKISSFEQFFIPPSADKNWRIPLGFHLCTRFVPLYSGSIQKMIDHCCPTSQAD